MSSLALAIQQALNLDTVCCRSTLSNSAYCAPFTPLGLTHTVARAPACDTMVWNVREARENKANTQAAPLPRARHCCIREAVLLRFGRGARAAEQQQRAARRAALVAALACAQAQARRRRPRRRVRRTRRPAARHRGRQKRGQRASGCGADGTTRVPPAPPRLRRARQWSGVLKASGAAHTFHAAAGGGRALAAERTRALAPQHRSTATQAGTRGFPRRATRGLATRAALTRVTRRRKCVC